MTILIIPPIQRYIVQAKPASHLMKMSITVLTYPTGKWISHTFQLDEQSHQVNSKLQVDPVQIVISVDISFQPQAKSPAL